MARSFDRTSQQYLEAASAVLSAAPLTMACWFNSNDDANVQVLMCLGSSSSPNLWNLRASGSIGGDPLTVETYQAGSGTAGNTTTGYSTNTWHHAAMTAATDNRYVYIDGGSVGQDSSSKTPANIDRTVIGSYSFNGLHGWYMSGNIAEAGIWNVVLDTAEIVALADGYSPLLIRPGSLALYVPLVRDNDEDIVGGLSLTASGSPTIAAHPRVFYSIPPQYFMGAGAGGVENYQSAAGVLTPVGTIIKSGRKILIGASTLSGSISKSTTKTFTGSSTLVGILVKQTQKAFTGSTTAVGILVNQAGKNLAGSITASGTLIKSTAKLLTGSVTAVGALVKQARKVLLGSLTLSGILSTTKATLLSIGGSLTPSGILVKQTGKIVLGSLVTAGTLAKQTAKAFTGSVTAAGSLIKQTAKSFVGSVTAVGILATQKIVGGYYQVVGGALTMSGIVVKQTNKIFTGSVTAAGILVRRIVKAFTGFITAVGALTALKSSFQVIGGALTMAGGLVRQTSKQTAGIITMAGSITKRISIKVSGVLTAVGALARQLLGLPTPYDQTFAIPSENRIYAIAAEVRIYSIPG